MLCAASHHGPAACVEAELFGGAGLQACLLANGGETVEAIYIGPHAINRALAFLGVTIGEAQDEFDAVQLGRYRKTEDWITHGLTS